MYLTNVFRVVATYCTPRPKQNYIIIVIDERNVLWKETEGHPCCIDYNIGPEKFVYPQSRAVKVYCWPCQLKIYCFFVLFVEVSSYLPGKSQTLQPLSSWWCHWCLLIPSGIWHFSQFTILVDRGNSSEFPHFTDQGTSLWVCLLQLHISVLDK